MEGLLRSSVWQTCSNPSIRCSRWVWPPSYLVAQLRESRMPRGISSPIGKRFSRERIPQEYPLVGARFAHGRVAGSSRNASRIYHRRSPSHSTLYSAWQGGKIVREVIREVRKENR